MEGLADNQDIFDVPSIYKICSPWETMGLQFHGFSILCFINYVSNLRLAAGSQFAFLRKCIII